MAIFFSILVPFRDRDTEVLDKCLESFSKQKFQDFELLFLDYGSRHCAGQARAICAKYPFVRYFQSQTEGRLWCRADTLNILTVRAVGKYLMITDADIYLESPQYLQLAYQEIQKQSNPPVLELRCYATNQAGKKLKMRTTRGMCIIERELLIAQGGYDTFFKQWGVEDNELMARLEKATGTKFSIFAPKEAHLVHIWHPHDYSKMPRGWLDILHKYASEKLPNPTPLPAPFPLLAYQDRPVLQQIQTSNNENVEKITFAQPLAYSFNSFLGRFMALEAGKCLCVVQSFDYYADTRQTWGKSMTTFFNKILARVGFSYRFVDVQTASDGFLSLLEVRDFLFYFIVYFESQILDYYFDYDTKNLTFWVCKKNL